MFSLQIGREESIVHEWLDVCVKFQYLLILKRNSMYAFTIFFFLQNWWIKTTEKTCNVVPLNGLVLPTEIYP
jgi:hypothetical protein